VKLNPLTYTVDAARGALLGMNTFPMALDMGAIIGFAILMVFVGSLCFSRMK
jgi:ABC-type polysaccharide/polyol phosphate export permease